MKRIASIVLFLIAVSCTSRTASEKDFIDKLLDLTIESSTGDLVELPRLYDSLATQLPTGETSILVRRLKSRGFEITNYGWGNYPPLGPRIANFEMTKTGCQCTISKIYYWTIADDRYEMSERISCEKVKNSNTSK